MATRLEPVRCRGALRGGVVAIGNFDGVHRGHQAVLARALTEAAERGEPALVLTFEPHPRTRLPRPTPVFRLTPAPIKARICRLLGLRRRGRTAVHARFAASRPEDFVDASCSTRAGRQPCRDRLRLPFRQGPPGRPGLPDGGGRAPRLRRHAGRRVFATRAAEVISSSRIRELLGEGDVRRRPAPARLPLHRRGRGVGRAASSAARSAIPPPTWRCRPTYGLRHGIYAVRFRRADGAAP